MFVCIFRPLTHKGKQHFVQLRNLYINHIIIFNITDYMHHFNTTKAEEMYAASYVSIYLWSYAWGFWNYGRYAYKYTDAFVKTPFVYA